MAKKKHKKGKNNQIKYSDHDEVFSMIYNPQEDRDWADWIVENNMNYVSDVSLEDYQNLRRLLLRGSGFVLNDIAKGTDYNSFPDFFGQGLSLNEYKWYRAYDDERKYTSDYKSRKRYIENQWQYVQRREVTNLDKFQVPLTNEDLRRMTLFYGIQLFDEMGNMVFAAVLYKSAKERHIIVRQWFIDASKRQPAGDIIPKDAILRSNTMVYGCDYPRFTVISRTDNLNLRPFTTADGDILAVPEKLPYLDSEF